MDPRCAVRIEQGRATAAGNGAAHQLRHTLLRVFPSPPGLHRPRREPGDHFPAPIAGGRHLGSHGHVRSEVLDMYRLIGVRAPRRRPPPVVATDQKGVVSYLIIAITMRTTEFPGEPSPSVPSFTTYAWIYAADNNALPVFRPIGALSEIPIPKTTSRTRLRSLRTWPRRSSSSILPMCRILVPTV